MMGSASREIRFCPWMQLKGVTRRLGLTLKYFHRQGAFFEYDDAHAQNREVLTHGIPFIVRTRS
jgi:hypothetical protein